MIRILVVDDEEEVRNLLSRFFQKKNYDTLTADSGEAALATLQKEKVDAVLLDIRMPGLDGLEVLRRIRADNPDLPVVMVSGEDDEDVAKATLNEGAFDYVMKPINFDYLERTVYFRLAEKLL